MTNLRCRPSGIVHTLRRLGSAWVSRCNLFFGPSIPGRRSNHRRRDRRHSRSLSPHGCQFYRAQPASSDAPHRSPSDKRRNSPPPVGHQPIPAAPRRGAAPAQGLQNEKIFSFAAPVQHLQKSYNLRHFFAVENGPGKFFISYLFLHGGSMVPHRCNHVGRLVQAATLCKIRRRSSAFPSPSVSFK